jgi:hypothetical protein
MTTAAVDPVELARNLAALAFADEAGDLDTCLQIALRAVLNEPADDRGLMVLIAGDAASASVMANGHRNNAAIAMRCGLDPSAHMLAAERWDRIVLSGAISGAEH